MQKSELYFACLFSTSKEGSKTKSSWTVDLANLSLCILNKMMGFFACIYMYILGEFSISVMSFFFLSGVSAIQKLCAVNTNITVKNVAVSKKHIKGRLHSEGKT